jgi:hypothetical protein
MAVNVAAPAVQFRNVGVKNVVSELHVSEISLLSGSQPADFANPLLFHFGTLKIGGFIKGVK